MTAPTVATPPPDAGQVAVQVTGWSLHLPDGDELATALAGWATVAPGRLADALAGAVAADRAHEVLGRKGLLYKEPATRLALCAVHRALGLPPGRHLPPAIDPETAVVVAGNLGNVATVAELAQTIRTSGGRAVSPLAAPNASSNVVASTVALWFRFGGPNLMLCSGATAGLDAVRAAALLLRTGRARRVVVVGVEPADEVATELHRQRATGAPLRAGAACLVLERAPTAAADEPPSPAADGMPGPVFLDGTGTSPTRTLGPDGFDLARRWGDCYGAAGVVGAALAATLLDAGEPGPIAVVCADPVDGRRAAQFDGRHAAQANDGRRAAQVSDGRRAAQVSDGRRYRA